MAIRIFDQTIGQTAGVLVTTTGNGAPKRDGTEAYAQMTVSASGSGLTGDSAAEGNVVSLSGATIASGTITLNAADEYVIIDTEGFENVALTVSGFGTAVLEVQWSNLTSGGFVAGLVSTVGSTAAPATSITADGQYTAPAGGRYLKLLVSSYTSGTLLVTPTFYAGGGSGSAGGGGGSSDATAANQVLEIAALDALVAAAEDPDPSLIEGATAADAALTANPVTGGGLAKTANPTAVADGDVVNSLHDKLGKQVTVGALRELKGRQKTQISSSTAETTIVTATASVYHDLYGLIISNTSATDTDVSIRDDTAGSVIMVFSIKAGQTAGFMVDAGSAIAQAATNDNWTAQCADSVAAIEITALFVTNI